MLNLFCTIGSWLGSAAFVVPILRPVFLAYVYAFACVAFARNILLGVR